MKKLIIFDLDGTLAQSKSPLDQEMSSLLDELLGVVKVAIISGGDWPQFKTQILTELASAHHLANLWLLPTCGTKCYSYEGEWKRVYSEDLTVDERRTIIDALHESANATGLLESTVWGDVIEDRATQVTFSALGQHAPLAEKEKWDPDFAKRQRMKSILDARLPGFSVSLGGTTSIDVTKAGIDKAYGVRRLHDLLGVALDDVMYIGDALFAGGNDYPVAQTGVVSLAVRGPSETKLVVRAVTACLASPPRQ